MRTPGTPGERVTVADEPGSLLGPLVTGLEQSARSFVIALVETGSAERAVRAAGYEVGRWQLTATRMLARQEVRISLQRAAEACHDPRRALELAALLAPGILVRAMAGEIITPSAVSAARDVLDRAGYGAVHRSEHTTRGFSATLGDILASRGKVPPVKLSVNPEAKLLPPRQRASGGPAETVPDEPEPD